jgi:putative transposase
VRQPQTPPEVVRLIRTVRERYPRWGKAKLAVLVRREGCAVSDSTIGRTLTRLRALGQLNEPAVVRAVARRWRRRRARPYAQRLPWGYVPQRPGDLVEIDTTPVEVRPGLRRVHFTARDVVSRKDVLTVSTRTSSAAATQMLREAFRRFGFRVRAIQIDGGSEFKATFEAACADLRIKLFVLPPRSPASMAMSNGRTGRIRKSFMTSRRSPSSSWITSPYCNAGRRRITTSDPTRRLAT